MKTLRAGQMPSNWIPDESPQSRSPAARYERSDAESARLATVPGYENRCATPRRRIRHGYGQIPK